MYVHADLLLKHDDTKMTYLSANLKKDQAMIREAKGTELENDDGATAAVVNLPAWSAAIRGNRRRLIDTDPSAEQQLILYRSEREHLLIPHNPFITRARATRTGAGHQHDLYPIRREDKCGAGTSSAPTTAPLFLS